MNRTKKVTVVAGAGLTGLSAAWKLASNGRNCLLLEQRSSPGGLAGSQVMDDILFDLGPHFIFPETHSQGGLLINELLAEGEVISREFRYAIITDKHHFKMPIKGDILSYPLKYKKQILSNILTGSKSTAPARSLCHFIESKFGKAYYKEVFGPMIQKKTGRDGTDLHVDWYIRPERDFKNNQMKMLAASSKMKRILQPLKTFFTTNHYCYPLNGFGAIGDRIFSRYQDAGGTTIFNCGEIELDCSEHRVESCRVRDLEMPVQDIIWTVSTDGLASLLPGVKKAELPQIDTIILLLTFNGKRLQTNQYSYTYHPDEDIIFNRAYSPENIFKQTSPADKEGLCLEINWFNRNRKECNGNSIEEMTEEEIIQRALDDVERLGFFNKKSLRCSRFIRLKKSLPVYGLDYKHQLTAHNQAINTYANVYAVGRSGGYYFCMSPAAVNQGLKTADHILDVNHSS